MIVKEPLFTIERKQRNVHVIRLSEKRDILLISDLHWDNPKCDRALLKSHLDEAVKRNAIILINGDAMCLMQGKFDPRGTKKDVRPEHNKGNYLDLVIEDFAEYMVPYAHHLGVIGYGNHETNIIKRLETDPLQRAVDLMNYKAGSNVQTGGYGGWVVFSFSLESNRRASFKIKYFHGSGGGGVVTKGTINHQRLDTMISDADCIWGAHIHDQWVMSVMVEELNNTYSVEQKEVVHIQTPSYKNEYDDGNSGWHIERGAPPKPLGGYWMQLEPKRIIEKTNTGNKDNVKIYARVTKTDY